MRRRAAKRASGPAKPAASLARLRPLVAGIDIGSREHWVCGPAGATGDVTVRRFGSTTPDLEALSQWLKAQAVESVAMESTSVYWIPVYELLESHGIEVLLVNAQHLRNVPGRKSDVQDCQWIQLLHSHGLLSGSFRPHQEICALRTLRRQCSNLVEERTQAVQWMQKALDQMNVQVHRAVSDLTGETGLAMVRAIVAGERDPEALARNRNWRCKKTHAEIAACLKGTWRPEHLFNLKHALELYDHLTAQIAAYDAELRERLRALEPPDRHDTPVPPHPNPQKEGALRRKGVQPLRESLYRVASVDLFRIEGVNQSVAETVLTEVGPDLSAFSSEQQFVSWLKLAPHVPVSGGKRLKTRRRKGTGATRVANVLRMAALSLRHAHSALGAEFRRIARTKDAGVAVFAVARKLAKTIYRMLRYGQDYVDIGEQAYEQRFQDRRLRGLRVSARDLGFHLVPVTTNVAS